ncbi:MAG: aldolase catalytic domain-containing protein [Lachnospiraceae bacterium]|nr:aldolase catalytic domain-containing protein [Lachnospiraceae bacterium]
MRDNIQILDCTLRDGGHIVNGVFGETAIKNVIKNLVEARIDIIEAGFLWDKPCDINTARYYNIADFKRVLPKEKGVSRFSLMADFIDVDHVEPYDGTVDFFRLSFKRFRLDWGLKAARTLMDKGYKVYINPVNCNVYSDEEYLSVIRKVNELHPYGFSIVDTFGVMRNRDLTHLYSLVDHNLLPDICIGLHLHENMGLAYSLSQHALTIRNPKRPLSIDGSLLGMGRVPGNLCIEQIMDHLNIEYGHDYVTEPALDSIDAYIAPIKARETWGYSIPYALSAQFHLHRTYAEYLMGRGRLLTKDIKRILSKVSRDEAEMFNEKYIEGLYQDYMNEEIDDSAALSDLSGSLEGHGRILLVAPGSSLVRYREKIEAFLAEEDTLVIAVNFEPDYIKADYIFCTSAKRHAQLGEKTGDRLLITSNLLRDELKGYCQVYSYNNLSYSSDIYCDDSTVMAITLLERCGVTRVYVAGFDGFRGDTLESYLAGSQRERGDEERNRTIAEILKRSLVDVVFLTPSIHDSKSLNKTGALKDGPQEGKAGNLSQTGSQEGRAGNLSLAGPQEGKCLTSRETVAADGMEAGRQV